MNLYETDVKSRTEVWVKVDVRIIESCFCISKSQKKSVNYSFENLYQLLVNPDLHFLPQAQWSWWRSCKSKRFAGQKIQEQVISWILHFASLANAVQLVDLSLKMVKQALKVIQLLATYLIYLKVETLETANILNSNQDQQSPEMSLCQISTGSEEIGSKSDHLMDPSSTALSMVG